MQIGVDSFAAAISDPLTGLTLSPVDRMQHLLQEIELADRVGLDVFGIGEHHREEFLDSAPAIDSWAAAAAYKEYSPHQCRNRSQRSGPCACFSGICHTGSSLEWPLRRS